MKDMTEVGEIQRALHFGPEDAALLRATAPRIAPCVGGWVERFYARLQSNPTAIAILGDEGRILRLQRSLSAWFHEMLTLTVDEAYARAREEIGRTHVRIGMPQHLMVAAMNGLREDVRVDAVRAWPEDPAKGEAAAAALSKALDVELALMLEAYRRRTRELALRQDATVLAHAVARRCAETVEDAVDATLCRTEGLRRLPPGDPRLPEHLARVDDSLRSIGELARRWIARFPPIMSEPRRVSVEGLLHAVAANVSLPPGTVIHRDVEPPTLEARLHVASAQLALEELVQAAVNRDPGGSVRVSVRGGAEEGVEVEVAHDGSPEPSLVATHGPESLGLAYVPIAAELHDGTYEAFRPVGFATGVRLILRRARYVAPGTPDAHRPVRY